MKSEKGDSIHPFRASKRGISIGQALNVSSQHCVVKIDRLVSLRALFFEDFASVSYPAAKHREKPTTSIKIPDISVGTLSSRFRRF